MKIYLVICGFDYEGSEVKACLSTREEADTVAEKFRQSDNPYDTVEVLEWTVGQILE